MELYYMIALVVLVLCVIWSCYLRELSGFIGYLCALIWCANAIHFIYQVNELKKNPDRVAIEKRAIETNMAHFDSKTGEFTWSDNNMRFVIEGYEQE